MLWMALWAESPISAESSSVCSIAEKAQLCAARGPRLTEALCQAMQAAIRAVPNLEIIEAEADDLLIESGRASGVRLADGREIAAGAVVLTTGTFLRGLIHIGEKQIPAGRVGEAPAMGLSRTLENLGLALGRLKTGTPPRLDGRTIDWSALEMQPGDNPPEPFSILTTQIENPQIECGITRTLNHTQNHSRKRSSFTDVFGTDRKPWSTLLSVDRR